MLWVIINPMIQIGIYWLVFGYFFGDRGVVTTEGEPVPYVWWLVSGIIVWFFINPSVTKGSRSIYSRLRFIAKMNFPMSTIPSYVIFAKFYQHLMLTAIILVILQLSPYKISAYIVQLPYFMFATLAFLISVSLITSTFTTIVRDLQQVIVSIMRMMIYLTPFLWSPDRVAEVSGTLAKLMMLNPMYYLAEGYRATMLGLSWYGIDHLGYTLYFWGFVFVTFLFGSVVHLRFRNHFVDYL